MTMKRLFALIVCLAILIPSVVFAAGTVTVTRKAIVPQYIEQVIFTCVGDATNGSIPNTPITQEILRHISGMYLYCVTADPGATQPDASADVFILNARNEDLLGSADNTTAGNGAGLLLAELTRTTLPKLYLPGVNFYPVVDGLLTLQVSNQGNVDATYVITLTFVK
jgi:hypothetical protein